ncbi:MAG: chromosome segregation protein SMC [Azospirillaceae bacterium]
MVQFAKLRLTGFKSFVDPTELVIADGVTGIVGPNGCGKSNLVEALRWVMGENSARRMRGSEMDDVIFGGTDDRPARNLAEVVLELDNADRTAPAQFNHEEFLEVSRRIERTRGSDYRINGKSVRARDIQLLFQDNSSGANSPALVSQGRVGALINAKPTERRLLLEEAAGIMGLHSRRHEAELRLKAAEDNLDRLDDVITTMDAQLQGLKKQARQAARYRSISERIRAAEAGVLHLRWVAAKAELVTAREALNAAEEAVRERTLAVSRATTVQSEAAEALPPLRQAEAEAAAGLQRLIIAREGLEEQERQLARAVEEARSQQAQIERDIDRERALAGDAGEALERLAEEEAAIVEAQAGEGPAAEMAERALGDARQQLVDLEADLGEATEAVAHLEAERAALDRQIQALRDRGASIGGRIEQTKREIAELAERIAAVPGIAAAEDAVGEAQSALDRARTSLERAGGERGEAEAAEQNAREILQEVDGAQRGLKAESDGLRALLAGGDDDLFPPLVDAVKVARGFETAFAAALGDAIAAPLDEAAPVHWRTLPAYEDAAPLPAGAEPLARHVKAPAALARRLQHVGLVDGEAEGRRLAPDLAPGQVLISREGGVWRWDGYSAADGTPTAAAARLEQRNRLAELERMLAEGAHKRSEAATAHASAMAALQAAQAAEREARQAQEQALRGLSEAQGEVARRTQSLSQSQARLDAARDLLRSLEEDHVQAKAEGGEAETRLAGLADPAAGRTRLAEARALVAESRTVLAEAQAERDRIGREAAARRERLQAIARERDVWQRRSSGAGERIAELESRHAATRDRLDGLERQPGELADRRGKLAEEIDQATRGRQQAADRLAQAETAKAEADRSLKAAESALAETREARVRADAGVASAKAALDQVVQRIGERIKVRPEGTAALAGIDPEGAPPDPAALESRLERLLGERERIGPVNLRAEQEAEELAQQIAGMVNERDDLIAAIDRLRRGIAQLNREAKERLLGSFETVNTHFQELFVRLFGGGRAHLALTDQEDPLNAGLDIFASPPGKKLQHLSLLSGGEQALTAISVLFAVFMTNPAPICVLDEVDAPLDDANVDRFCSLVEELARDGLTRFLLITHHRMTMARVDRLFGVTMPEKGVSQLVSVDLRQAADIRRTA